ncbi:MAG: PKD domain-containing protein [Acidobacteria bacterium]|nr:PKD domain-containing protein [Acidobacteriota bacterium]
MSSRWKVVTLVAMAATLVGACDKAQLLAPTKSTITVSAPAQVLPNGGSIEITAYVIEQAGTPVQNGTAVHFTTSLGTIEPQTAQTRNGLARATFRAGSSSGIAEIRAMSGGATSEENLNVVKITVGAAAVSTVTLRANPGSVGPSGGVVELIASVISEGGQGVEGVMVTFATDQGTLSAATAPTNASGEARTTLTTSVESNVTATAGSKTSSVVKVPLRAGPIVSIACAPATGSTNCAGLQAGAATNSAIALLTITKPTGSSALRNVTLDFGDGESTNLGNLASGTAAISHAYAGPSGSTPRSYTATVRAEDINGEVSTAFTSIVVSPRASIGVSLTATSEAAAANGQRWTFTATPTTGTDVAAIQSYEWDFGDDDSNVTTSTGSVAHIYTEEGRFTVRVTLHMLDGRTALATTEILVNLP